MGAFIGYGHIGVWASNGERDAFLDWFAAHRCNNGDASWQFCMSPANRWSGCSLALERLIPQGKPFDVTMEEYSSVAFPSLAQLLVIISAISHNAWTHAVDSEQAIAWRRDSPK